MKNKKINILKFHKYISNGKIPIILNGHFGDSVEQFSNSLLATMAFDKFYYINYENLNYPESQKMLELFSFECSCCGESLSVCYEKNRAFIRQPKLKK